MNCLNLIRATLTLMITFLMCSVSTAQLFWDQACYFPGTNTGYISVKHNSQLNLASSFTIEMWINPANSTSPANQNLIQKRETGSTGYAVLLTNGKVSIRTNNTTRVTGNIVLPSNQWTHIAARYNSSSNNFSVYVNSTLDASAIVAGALPVVNSDSLWIGKGSNNPFEGMMDNLRIWKDILTPTQLSSWYTSMICTNSGKYFNLVLSIPFQKNNSAGNDFSVDDKTSYNHNVVNRGVTALDLSSRPSVTSGLNEGLFLQPDPNESHINYLAGKSGPGVEPSTGITIEAWIYPVSLNDGYVKMIVGNRTDNTVNYAFYYDDITDAFNATIEGNVFNSNPNPLTLNVWTHVAFTYSSTSGVYEFFVNGNRIGYGIESVGNILYSSQDSVFVGMYYNGYIDEVRISDVVKTEEAIKKYLYQGVDEANNTNGINKAVYSFDGYLSSTVPGAPALHFRNDADFSHPSGLSNVPVSPLIRSENFYEGFDIENSGSRIPFSPNVTSGYTSEFIHAGLNETLTDINVFVALNHTEENSLKVVLYSPDNDSCVLFDQHELANESDNLVTIFDDQADSSISNAGRYVSVQSRMKPTVNLSSVFAGTQIRGMWKLRIYDYLLGDIGRIYAWGIQFNNYSYQHYTLVTTSFIQGFASSNGTTVRDTISCKLRTSSPPYSIIATGKDFFTTEGVSIFNFNPVSELIPSLNNCYIQMNHRNSIETWSSGVTDFDVLSPVDEYGFTGSASDAYGDNMMEIRHRTFAFYGGDVNQDGEVDLSDITIAYNGANIFLTGYVAADVTGDSYVDLSDLSLIYNNSISFVSVIRP